MFSPAVQGTSTEQNVERGQEGRENTRKHEWNSFHPLRCTGFGMRWPGLTSFTSELTDPGAFLPFFKQCSVKVVKHHN